ncbi:pH-response regulator protein palC [Sodiomyces alkalinus F11]|uniref:pH-response regulator protein palC n=1 Tax=Sodiomyces alkalinus (strain CBS 110278 / VKM F-3762 / F11) TaxID=1314773 RepID=A0A3N2PRZ6_SODAK|nr:pH-response regulator protein palC [Sodiomyces alkalinus F11]ROT37275.1 pH-response regulator protein palC [Sodiomyces alkalinus F11]
MPFPFVLPTTSSFSFSASFRCDSHPSLPLTASTYRGVVRDALKKHKRLPSSAQSPHLSSVVSSLTSYLPYLLAIDAGVHQRGPLSSEIRVTLQDTPAIEWRPTLSDTAVPGREPPRVKVRHLDHEIAFALSTLAEAYTLVGRSALHPLYVTSAAVPTSEERTLAIQTATRHLLDAASIYEYLATRADTNTSVPCADIAPTTLRGLAALAHAEATLLAVLKDDPYPAIVSQSRNETDREWMYKSPDIPKVRAHLFARLCLAAAEHAAKASSLCQTRVPTTGDGGGGPGAAAAGKVNDALLRYLEDTRRTCRARACRFFGIDAELGGQTGTALAWLRAGLQELGVESREAAAPRKGGLSAGLSRFKKDWAEKREDKRVEREAAWGADGGRLEETRVIEHLEAQWTKVNDMIASQPIPPTGPLIAQMPSGRDIHVVKPYQVPQLDRTVLEATRAPPDRTDDGVGVGDGLSSDEEAEVGDRAKQVPVGAYPGSRPDHGSRSSYY